jgi:tryptophan 2,3-dioxygenase
MSIEQALLDNTLAIKALSERITILQEASSSLVTVVNETDSNIKPHTCSPDNSQEQPTPEKPKRKRRTKAEIATDKLANEAQAYEEAKSGDDCLDDAPKEEAQERTYRREDVKAALLKVRDTLDANSAREIMKEVGATAIPEIKESDFAKVIAQCESAIDGLDAL